MDGKGIVSVGIWALREEARKSWDYIVSDKVVYFFEPLEANFERAPIFSKRYLHGDVWLEVHWTQPSPEQGELHFESILEVTQEILPSPHRKANIQGTGGNGDGSMLIQGPEFMQLPKGVIPVGIPSVVRLKRVNVSCHCGWEQTEPIPVIRIIQSSHRKGDIALLSVREDALRVKMGQSPRQLVERRAETADEVPEEHSERFWGGLHPDSPDFEYPFEICFTGNGVGWKINPLVELDCKGFEMRLRPAGFHISEG